MASARTPRQRELFEIAKSYSWVNLKSSGIADETAVVIAEGLKENRNLQMLDLSDNQIGDAGAQAIGAALRKKTKLSVLLLSNNKIGETGARAIAEGLQTSTALTQLGMHTNQIGDAGAQAIGPALRDKAKLSLLHLESNKIGDAGARAIAEGLKTSTTLTKLGMRANLVGDAGAQAIASTLRNKANLSILYLDENKVGDAGARAVAEGLQVSTALTRLGMDSNRIGHAGAQAIAAALRNKANLSRLSLSNNKIGDTGAQAIAESLQTATALTELGMQTNHIGDAGAQAIGSTLRNKANLSILYLHRNKIGDTGARAIAEGLQTLSALTDFRMNDNQIGDAGAHAIGSALRNKATLSKLSLSNNQISSSAAQLLSQSVPKTCEFSAESQRGSFQDATPPASPSVISTKTAHLSDTPSSPLPTSDSMSQDVRQLQARIAQLELAQQTTNPINSGIPRVPLQVLSQATAQFSESKRIGAGGFGHVYSGVWSGQPVAVKRLAAGSNQGVAQFESELEALSRFRHPNIVTIMCYAQEGNERCLAFELMANGSVRDRLDRKGGTPALSWDQRRNIATSIANAMHFVQTAIPRQPLFHLDLKTDNVLLDAQFNAKVADFGLTRSAPMQVDGQSYVHTQTVQGTLLYICPEYQHEGKVSIKTDVYSYGMILLELVTGQPPSLNLMANVRRELKKSRKVDAVLDKAIDWSIQDKEAAQAMAELASDCLETVRVDRPSFGEILRRLSGKEAAGANEEEAVAGSDRECLVCFNAPTNAKLMPCYHACVCVACAQWMIQRQDKCMICRVPPTSFQEGTFNQTFVQ
ncbi:protein tyrosine kinase, variant [Capsaspora owczarzaki ATCC 30864]|uniref:protein tyrosine kinase, variant n=1 Tax=Capsaspora owczarzaki (strain ATCC 30864) TaxID=595528 RepID=UPI0003522E3D|nr:protein tyrosine kinase, variant [Capsaspora owczarzaki ATCC 30864]|eukprot:XP_011269934.1 protein tyrosine kinase, variant [Capsaspora owczarzaki ATCC 30864]